VRFSSQTLPHPAGQPGADRLHVLVELHSQAVRVEPFVQVRRRVLHCAPRISLPGALSGSLPRHHSAERRCNGASERLHSAAPSLSMDYLVNFVAGGASPSVAGERIVEPQRSRCGRMERPVAI
jgi:hypothetical protein